MAADGDALDSWYWTDWAPWLARFDAGGPPALEALGETAGWWWFERIGATVARTSVRELASGLAAVLADQRAPIPDLPLTRLLPYLPLRLRIEDLRASTLGAAAGLLRRRRLYRVADIAAMSVRELCDFQGWGIKSSRGTLASLMEASLEHGVHSGVSDGSSSPAGRRLLRDATTVALWRHLAGQASVPLLRAREEDLAPLAVQAAVERLRALTAADLVPDARLADPVARLEDIVAAMSDSDRVVLAERLLSEEPEPRSDLARRLRITPGAVRVTERRVTEQVEAVLDEAPAAMAAEAARRMIPQLMRLDRVLARLPVLAGEIPSLCMPLWRVLTRFGRALYESDGWIGTEPIDQSAGLFTAAISEALRVRGTMGLADAAAYLPTGVDVTELESWLGYCDFEITDDGALTPRGSTADRAVRALARSGEPLSLSEITEAVGNDASHSAVVKALAGDGRIVRTEALTYALASWRTELRLADVQDLVRHALVAAGGRLPLERLTATLTQQYAVPPAIVRRVSSQTPFRTEEGTVRWSRSLRT